MRKIIASSALLLALASSIATAQAQESCCKPGEKCCPPSGPCCPKK